MPIDPCTLHTEGNSTTTRDFSSFNKTLRSIIPPSGEFEKSFSNPCWYMQMHIPKKAKRMLLLKGTSLTDEEALYLLSEIFAQQPGRYSSERILYCIPKVYFIGFPKSGSTQLYKMLMEHPQLVGGLNKEPHWWTRFHFVAKFPNNLLAILRYLIHYGEAAEYIHTHPQALAIDGSQSTIWDTRSFTNLCMLPTVLSGVVPSAKYIVIMREPTSRLYSDFAYLCEEYWEHHNLKNVPRSYLRHAPDMFDEAVDAEINGFEHCLETSPLEVCTHYALYGKESTTGCGRVRLGISLYYSHIIRWFRTVPKDQFLFLRTEDLANNPYALLQAVWGFLGLPEQSATDLKDVLFEHYNTNQVSHRKSVQMLEKTKQKLREFFRPFNEELARLLNSEKFMWLDI